MPKITIGITAFVLDGGIPLLGTLLVLWPHFFFILIKLDNALLACGQALRGALAAGREKERACNYVPRI